jgi:hypothetical protein
VWTVDEHDETSPIKRFPIQGECPEAEYLARLVDTWRKSYLFLIEKSRQMLVTWLMVACHLWLAQFNDGKLVFFQSKKEEDADSNLERAKFIYDHQPFWLRMHPETRKYCHLDWPDRHSRIWAIAQGPDVIRQYTASAIFSDEMAFQERAEDAFIAAKPTIDGGGRFSGTSSAYPGFFEELCRDRV